MKATDLRRWQTYFNFRDQGLSIEDAARKARLSPSTAYRFERGDQSSGGLEAAQVLGREMVGGNLVAKPLSPQAQQALDDFAYCRLRYFGRRSMPWQERAAYDVLSALEDKKVRSYLVINCPPGSGKSTLFTHDIICWLVARNRSTRIMIGSRTERQARMYVGRIKKTLERDAPMRADAEAFENGWAVDAIATMQDDYTAFRPPGRSDLWRAEALVVRQLDGTALDDKEPTVSAWGQDSGFLGGRFDLVIWDDLVDKKNTTTSDGKARLQDWYVTEAETRVEPGGAFILQGQRIAHDDLYRFALDLRRLDDTPKYQHIVYPAHDDEHCRDHNDPAERTGALYPPAWPEGCLLDPFRLPMAELEAIKRNTPRVFEVQYQQRDGDLVGGLVEPEWIYGGTDSDGYVAPGCLDKQRSVGEVPPHLTDGRGWSFMSVDPSPTEWWGVIWWLYDPETDLRYALDVIRTRLNPEQFLTVDMDRAREGISAYSGLLEQTRIRSNMAGAPLHHVIVEINAAQRWLVQQPYVQRWMDATGIVILSHSTYANKADPKFGLESIGDLFRQGKIRLPYGDFTSRTRTNDLVKEALAYGGQTDDTTDLLMSTWFGKLAVENHYPGRAYGAYRAADRPGYLRGASRGLAGYRG